MGSLTHLSEHIEVAVTRFTERVHRRYNGKVLVIVSDALEHGFVFEPGDVTLIYDADLAAHPRDPREMVMTITGVGRMAAVYELRNGVQPPHGSKQEPPEALNP